MRIYHIKGMNVPNKNFNPLNSVVKIIEKSVKIESLSFSIPYTQEQKLLEGFLLNL